ncbi:MAG: Lsr2 family protein [Gordonia polyisoprenivorans]|nr:Lsr2 family protein [Gordonia polyisoprenivorans]
MAQAVHTVITDDLDDTTLDPSEATTVQWSWQGVNYEFDTRAATVAAIESDEQSVTVGLLLSISRRAETSRSRATKPAASSRQRADVEPKVIREWARLHGHDVPDRGRIPVPVRDAYFAGR